MPSPPHVMPALVTPFGPSGEVDLEAHNYNLATLWDRGIRGFLIGGSTGEGPYLEPGERHSLVTAARKTLGRRAFILCGIAAETVRQAQAFIDEAARGGADGALVVTPTTLTRGRLSYVEGFYTTLADSAPIPLYLYSVPSVTAFELPEESVARLARHPNIVGMKDSGGHPVRMQRLVTSTPDGFLLYTGSTQAVSLAIAAGAHGAITASVNYIPEKVAATVNAARRAPAKARQPQQQISRASMAVEAFGIPGVKAAAAAAGLRPGYPREPLHKLPEGEAHRLARVL
jgi:dihydrodipicolinate synthase/N-acetylneuraminate lyase